MDAAASVQQELFLTRELNAPRERVFAAWTDPHQASVWWAPQDCTPLSCEMDVRPGGVWRFVMHGPDGVDYKNKIVFVEVVKPERLTYRHAGEEVHDEVKFHTTVTFADRDGKTELTLRMVFATPEERDHVVETYGAIEGGRQTLERLAEHLAAA